MSTSTTSYCQGPGGKIQIATILNDSESDFSFSSQPAQPPQQPPQPPIEDKYVLHNITSQDTLRNLSLKYDTTSEAIQRINGLLVTDLDLLPKGTVLRILPGRKYIKQPPTPPKEEEDEGIDKRGLIRAMRMLLGGDVDPTEVEYYLRLTNWDVQKALAERRSDLEFERKNPMPKKEKAKKPWQFFS
eukprot:PhF_6_TR25746/c0_g1_i2/m.36290